MAKGLVNKSSLNSIGTAINLLKGTEETYAPSEMGAEIINAIKTETASGNLIHITDAADYPAVSCVTTLEPMQDLHGYDKPWPAGGGKNKAKPINCISDGYDGTTYNNVGEGAEIVGDVVLPAGDYIVSIKLLSNPSTNRTLTIYKTGGFELCYFLNLNNKAVNTVYTTTFSLSEDATVYGKSWGNGGGEYKIQIQIEAGSTATSYEPYSNECPISGHTGVELMRTGKNLLPPLPDYMYEVSGVTIKIQNSEVTLSGTATNAVLYDVRLSVPFVAEEGEYLHLCNSTTNNSVSFSFGGGNVNAFSKSTSTLEAISSVITENIGITCTYLRIYVAKGSNADITVKPMIVKSGTATAYEPYSSEPHSHTFPQAQSPVFGCEVDWVNGVLRVTKANIASYNGETLPGVWISDRDVYAEGTTPSIGAQVVYELATPIGIPLTPEVITLLKGENNIWTDAGTSEIEYKVDLNSYIQKLIDEASARANTLSLSKSAVLTSTDVEDGEEIEETDEPVTFDGVKESKEEVDS